MASPQTAHGYTKVANAIMRALSRFPFSGQELRILVWVLRDSYGWGEKSTHKTSLSRIEAETGIKPSTSSWAIRKLINQAVLIRNENHTLRFNKNYDEWLLTAPDLLPLLGQTGVKPVPKDAKPSKTFTPPTLDEVKDYAKSRNSSVDPDRFWHHYESNGWMSGKSPMKNWKSKICFWERSEKGVGGKQSPVGKLCPLCEANTIPNPRAVVCDKCGPRCRACGRETAKLHIIKRRDGSRTAKCRDGCDERPSDIVRASMPTAAEKLEAEEKHKKFMAEHHRRTAVVKNS